MNQLSKRVFLTAAAFGGLLLTACTKSQYSPSGSSDPGQTAAAPKQGTAQPGYGFRSSQASAQPSGGQSMATQDDIEPGAAESMQPGTATTGTNVSGPGLGSDDLRAQPAGAILPGSDSVNSATSDSAAADDGSGAGSADSMQPGTATAGSNPSRDVGTSR